MGKCSICGEKTRLFVDGRALCLKCEIRRTNPDELWENAKAAKAEYKELSERFDAINREVVAGGHGVPFPDSTNRIEFVGKQMRAAFKKYQQAMAAYVEALKRS